MIIKLLGLVVGVALCAGVASAQTSSKQPTAATSTSSAGEVSASVPQAAIEEQKDPKLLGSPAWWSTHATADGKPLSAEGTRSP
jgi:hypothetical protein